MMEIISFASLVDMIARKNDHIKTIISMFCTKVSCLLVNSEWALGIERAMGGQKLKEQMPLQMTIFITVYYLFIFMHLKSLAVQRPLM